jgi:hypothetical protein
MRTLLSAVAVFLLAAAPCAAEDYYGLMATAKHGNGYVPATVVAGWVRQTSFSVLSFTANGDRQAKANVATEWKAVLVTGPKAPPKDDDLDDDRYQDRRATTPKEPDPPPGPPEPRREITYSSVTCPALLSRMTALKSLTSFDFNLPDLNGNQDGPNGDGHQGFDLWMRIGEGELTKASGTTQSQLGQWFQQTTAALAACPGVVTPTP